MVKMKLPNTFVPEKGLDEKVEDLKSGADKNLSLKDLILDPEYLDGTMQCNKIDDPDAKSAYPNFNMSEVEEIMSLEYNPKNSDQVYTIKNSNTIYTVYTNIVQFKDKQALEKDLPNIVEKHKKLDLIAHTGTLIRSEYVIFIFMFSGDIFFHNKLVDVYKKEFGFKEV